MGAEGYTGPAVRIIEILSEDLILPSLNATRKADVITEMVDHIAQVRSGFDKVRAIEVLMAREEQGSTGVGNGFAIPHGKLPELTQVIACLACSVRGVDFNSLDGRPARLFFAVLAPEGAAGLHLKALARASRLFKEADFRAQLVAERQPAALWKLVSEQDERLSFGDDSRR